MNRSKKAASEERDIESLLAKRDIRVSYESICLWRNTFGREYAKRLKRKRQGYGDTLFSQSEVLSRVE